MRMACNNTNYPDELRRAGIEGRVVVSATIEPDGSVSHVRVV
ncbi:MAG: TonB family protein [Dechloromonas sp.]|nr:MAG: TonB family protein [Dechloromonas sp.]